ncbi:MAG: DUF308 domain-containing protein [Bacteroidales bacterium]|nr:DUF308 domain-containing protein [Bacteroidales bacterium]MDE5956520.1 DUF308 domain-containing protein [Bacteroidales bacterium]
MITFGYKSRVNGPLRAIVALGVGVVMVANPDEALTVVVKVIAAFFLASGLVSLLFGLKEKSGGALPLMSFNAGVDILLGVVLFAFPGFVASFIIYLIGFVLLAFGLVQIIGLVSARRIIPLGVLAFALPVLVTLVGGFIIFNPFAESVMSTIAGASLIVYGASELFSSWKMKKAIDEYEIHRTNPDVGSGAREDDFAPEIKDVDYEKVDEQ